MQRKHRKTQRPTISVNRDFYARLLVVSERDDVAKSQVVEQAIFSVLAMSADEQAEFVARVRRQAETAQRRTIAGRVATSRPYRVPIDVSMTLFRRAAPGPRDESRSAKFETALRRALSAAERQRKAA